VSLELSYSPGKPRVHSALRGWGLVIDTQAGELEITNRDLAHLVEYWLTNEDLGPEDVDSRNELARRLKQLRYVHGRSLLRRLQLGDPTELQHWANLRQKDVLSIPEKLELLAKMVDHYYHEENVVPAPEVQRDLRQWAKELREYQEKKEQLASTDQNKVTVLLVLGKIMPNGEQYVSSYVAGVFTTPEQAVQAQMEILDNVEKRSLYPWCHVHRQQAEFRVQKMSLNEIKW